MAKNNSKPPKASVYISVIGPAQDPRRGYNEPAFKEPSNPADQLRSGPLSIKNSPQQTLRRPFRFPTKPSLHHNEGLSMDEFNQPGHEEAVGEDKNQYSRGPNKPTTDEGECIRGT